MFRTLTTIAQSIGDTPAPLQQGTTNSTSNNQQPNYTVDPTITAIGQVMAAHANYVQVRIDSLSRQVNNTNNPNSTEGEVVDITTPHLPQRRLLCTVRAILKKMQKRVYVGDKVKVGFIDWTEGRGIVTDVFPRASLLAHPPVANVTRVVLVFAVDMPPFEPAQATRFLIQGEASSVPVTVILNKADLAADLQQLADMMGMFKRWGYQAIPVSVANGVGLDEVARALSNDVSVLAGPSGVGKSSIINALQLRSAGMGGAMDFLHEMAAEPSRGDGGNDHIEDEDENEWEDEEMNHDNESTSDGYTLGSDIIDGLELQAVGSVSARVGRGKHTTRNVTLIEMMSPNIQNGGISNGSITNGYNTAIKGGLLADTPGFSQPHLTGILPTQLAFLFPEVLNKMEEARAQGRQLCAFQNCQHLHEPGCGLIEGGWERHGMYADLHAEVSEIAGMDAQRAGSKKRREGMLRKKSGSGGVQREEARLEAKTYRRVSRKQEKQQLLSELAEQQKEEAEEEEEEEGGAKA